MKTKMFFAGLVALAMCACTNDDTIAVQNVNTDAVAGSYMKFNLQLPSTRSTTTSGNTDSYGESSDGTEIGKDYENTISNVAVVIYNTKDELVTVALDNAVSTGSDNGYVVAFDANELLEYAEKAVHVYVYANQTYDLQEKIITNKLDANAAYTLANATDGSIWTHNSFLMSNAEVCKVTLPSASKLLQYNSVENALNIGTVYVERSMARFDYKDGASGSTAYTYDLDNGISVELQEMALLNMSNAFYYLRRVSDDGTANGSNFKICGTEWCVWKEPSGDGGSYLPSDQTGNYVVDTDAAAKATASSSLTEDLLANFYYPMSDAETWVWTNMQSLSEADNDGLWNSDNTYGDYCIWRYATENTIPADAKNQVKGITTGVVFKGEMTAGETTSDGLKRAMEDGLQIFAYDNYLYGSWLMIEELANEFEKGTHSGDFTSEEVNIILAYEVVQGLIEASKENGDVPTIALAEAQAQAGFTGYTPESDASGYHYYTYYYYWNRHNNNGSDGVMGIMEFDVVRNNVYKLSVTGITGFGHPTPGGDDPDPDPEDPTDPDEEESTYLQLNVEVLPWVVRVNDITF